jgi:hypothetical protein
MERFVPKVGMFCSQGGNVLYSRWAYKKISPSLNKSLETPLYKGFEGLERFLRSLPNLSLISQETLCSAGTN